ncbi:hypothetical protein NK718_18780 [Alsobacter sp. SYSU M60028]|uniref:Uncharacterized protein n=1 Tax=Alsobacter ponti TaxID=2962936 RepID=A0ABT1LGE8_9HYPH|nr:hypothetical protein [Alsobacter ponti]MCP8940575.1 hypothetical protein [Alsobacter ponti]
MRRFLRHPLHRTAIVALIGAALLGYYVPQFATRRDPTSAAIVAFAVLAIVAYSWAVFRRRRLGAGGQKD